MGLASLAVWVLGQTAAVQSNPSLGVVERYTLKEPDHIRNEATIEDPKVFSRPWTMSMPLYRRQESNIQILEHECGAHIEEAKDAEWRDSRQQQPHVSPVTEAHCLAFARAICNNDFGKTQS